MTEVLVVHCVDAEGPMGGDARRRPDGSAEFFDSWEPIVESLRELCSARPLDSEGRPYRFSWFAMDFTGFRTNPKQRDTAPHAVLDRLRELPCEPDGIYWHYHVPPRSGEGDRWADSWLDSNEGNTILARRLLERDEFPAAFRAGGTIEDAAANAWLERAIPIDFSNRASATSRPDAPLSEFGWHGAPSIWGSYHPALDSPLRRGSLRRYVYRSLDLRSRVNEVGWDEIVACFRDVAESGERRVLSYFSHDMRDMRPETYEVWGLLERASGETGVPWISCTAVEAHRRRHGLTARPLALTIEGRRLSTDREPFQREPFTAAELDDGRFVRLYPRRLGATEWQLQEHSAIRRFAAAVTSEAGDVTVAKAA